MNAAEAGQGNVTHAGAQHLPGHCWWRDPQFAAACLAGPTAWWMLVQAGVPQTPWPGAMVSPWLFLWLTLGVAVLEEWVFRGELQPWFAQRFRRMRAPAPQWLANVATSGVFAALHLLGHPPAWAAAVLVPSLLFGHLRDRHGHLGSAIALHAFYNAGYFLVFGAALN